MAKFKYRLNKNVKEMSTTGGGAGAASFTPGTGAQHATPFAFTKNKKPAKPTYYYKLGYKDVPKKIKNSGLEVKRLFEEGNQDIFQKERINAFDVIEERLNNIYKMLSNAKADTIEYYNDNPSTFEVVYPTDLISEYIDNIEELLNQDVE